MARTWFAHVQVADRRLQSWLTGSGSLSWRIQRACPRFAVRRLCQHYAQPMSDEFQLAGLQRQQIGLVREVLLSCGAVPVIFAHSVVHPLAVRGPWRALVGLGNRPLATMLYKDPAITRHPLQFRKLNERHALYRQAAKVLPDLPAELWARRSVFVRHQAPLLVTELFLPSILALEPGV